MGCPYGVSTGVSTWGAWGVHRGCPYGVSSVETEGNPMLAVLNTPTEQ